MAAVAAQRGLAQLQRLVRNLPQRPHRICRERHTSQKVTRHKKGLTALAIPFLYSASQASQGPIEALYGNTQCLSLCYIHLEQWKGVVRRSHADKSQV